LSYYLIEPDAPGGLGPKTLFDRTGPRLEVKALHCVFDDWFGDCIVTSSPCFMVTEQAARLLEQMPATGVVFEQAIVSQSETFKELNADMELPGFAWLKVLGRPGTDDFGLSQTLDLVVSERVLKLLKQEGMPRAEFREWKG